ncbi:MAG: Ferritin Dps family protein [Massilia sp.]|nr:Ferritin Dps family protein [Massilia sp.]
MGQTQAPNTGMNRTGILMSPIDSKAMQEAAPSTMAPPGDESALAAMRADYIASADPVGSMPPPASVTGAVQAAVAILKGERPQVLLDKLGERLAFERTGTRLYDALITKCAVMLGPEMNMAIADLERIRADEARHFLLVAEAIESLGGDPTTQTPSADLAGVESMGLVQVLNDPRTTIAQSLHAILTAELSDKAGWETLVGLAEDHGLTELAADFTQALEKEREHLGLVTAWYGEALGMSDGQVEVQADAAASTAPRGGGAAPA